MHSDIRDLINSIEWANKRIDKLNDDVKDYASSSFRSRETKNLITGQTVLEIINIKPMPVEIRLETGSIAHEIRANLDRLACILAIRNNKNSSTDGVYFPINNSADSFAHNGKQKIKKLSVNDRTTIETLNPYKGGNDLLFALHAVDIVSKHIKLTSTANTAGSIGIGPGSITGGTSIGGGIIPDNGYAIVAVMGAGSTVNISVNIDVCFAEPNEVSGRPIVRTLRDFSRTVDDIINLFN